MQLSRAQETAPATFPVHGATFPWLAQLGPCCPCKRNQRLHNPCESCCRCHGAARGAPGRESSKVAERGHVCDAASSVHHQRPASKDPPEQPPGCHRSRAPEQKIVWVEATGGAGTWAASHTLRVCVVCLLGWCYVTCCRSGPGYRRPAQTLGHLFLSVSASSSTAHRVES